MCLNSLRIHLSEFWDCQPRRWNVEWVSTSLVPRWSMWALPAFQLTQTWVLNDSWKCNKTREGKTHWAEKWNLFSAAEKEVQLDPPGMSSLPHQWLCKSELRDGGGDQEFSCTPQQRVVVWSYQDLFFSYNCQCLKISRKYIIICFTS